MDLKDLRKEIDQTDKSIINLIAKRMETSRSIAEFKKQNNLPIKNSHREKEIIHDMINQARAKKIDSVLVKKVMKLLIKYSKKEQKKILNYREN